MRYLREKFYDWFKRASAQGRRDAFYREIAESYATLQRFYHTFEGHIAFCLRELEQVPTKMIADAEALEFSLFLHDIDPSEERSALIAIDLCRRMKLPEPFTALCAAHIRSTDHQIVPENTDSRLIIDIDLSILGQAKDVFDAYEKNIRKEYSYVPEESFRAGRAKILRHFLDRPSIFLTDYFQKRYEMKARKNLMRSIAKLEG